MTNRKLRTIQTWIHIVGGSVIGTYIYSPWHTVFAFDVAVKAVVFPAMVLTGVVLWKWGKIRSLFRSDTPDPMPEAAGKTPGEVTPRAVQPETEEEPA